MPTVYTFFDNSSAASLLASPISICFTPIKSRWSDSTIATVRPLSARASVADFRVAATPTESVNSFDSYISSTSQTSVPENSASPPSHHPQRLVLRSGKAESDEFPKLIRPTSASLPSDASSYLSSTVTTYSRRSSLLSDNSRWSNSDATSLSSANPLPGFAWAATSSSLSSAESARASTPTPTTVHVPPKRNGMVGDPDALWMQNGSLNKPLPVIEIAAIPESASRDLKNTEEKVPVKQSTPRLCIDSTPNAPKQQSSPRQHFSFYRELPSQTRQHSKSLPAYGPKNQKRWWIGIKGLFARRPSNENNDSVKVIDLRHWSDI